MAEGRTNKPNEEEEYIARYEAWKQQCDEIKAKREEAIKERRAQWIETKKIYLTNACKVRCERKASIIQTEEEKKARAERTLASLGALQFGKKKELRRIIEAANHDISVTRQAIEDEQYDVREALSKVDELFETEGRPQLLKQLVREMPLPPEMDSPSTWRSNRHYGQLILDYMIKGQVYDLEEVRQFPPVEDLTAFKVERVLEQMAQEGKVERIMDRNKAFYQALQSGAKAHMTRETPRKASRDVFAVPKNITYREENGQIIRNVELDFPGLSPEELTEFVRELEKAGIAKKIKDPYK